jgi:seryl-tRNA synthetase
MNDQTRTPIRAEDTLLPGRADGVYVRTVLFYQVASQLSALIGRFREAGTEVLKFPPVMSRSDVERSGYVHSFPHLLGCVCGLGSSEAEVRLALDGQGGRHWTDALSPTDLVLTPAACYPLYPMLSDRGALRSDCQLFDVESYCFRHEATAEFGRFQSFVMREYVCVGSAEAALEFRSRWMTRGHDLAALLGLAHEVAPASDPFFGRVGKLLASTQLEELAKFELLVRMGPQANLVACMSFNYHRTHFGKLWELRTPDGETAHTACAAFGIDRLALALVHKYGADAPKVLSEAIDTLPER